MRNFKIAFVSSIMTILILSTIFAYFYFNNKILLANQNSLNIENTSEEITVKEPTDEEKQLNNYTDELYQQRHNIITETVKKVSAAVVGINVTEIQQYH